MEPVPVQTAKNKPKNKKKATMATHKHVLWMLGRGPAEPWEDQPSKDLFCQGRNLDFEKILYFLMKATQSSRKQMESDRKSNRTNNSSGPLVELNTVSDSPTPSPHSLLNHNHTAAAAEHSNVWWNQELSSSQLQPNRVLGHIPQSSQH